MATLSMSVASTEHTSHVAPHVRMKQVTLASFVATEFLMSPPSGVRVMHVQHREKLDEGSRVLGIDPDARERRRQGADRPRILTREGIFLVPVRHGGLAPDG